LVNFRAPGKTIYDVPNKYSHFIKRVHIIDVMSVSSIPRDFPNLRNIYFEGCTAKAIRNIIVAMSHLKKICVCGMEIGTGPGLDTNLSLITRSDLEKIYVDHSDFPTKIDIHMNMLAMYTKLDTLELYNCNISNFDCIGEFHNLKDLCMTGSFIHPDNLVVLKNIKLKYLDIGNTNISDISALRNVTTLKLLYIYNTDIPDISPLANHPSLKTLYINNHITNMVYMPHLTCLYMSGVKNTGTPIRGGLFYFLQNIDRYTPILHTLLCNQCGFTEVPLISNSIKLRFIHLYKNNIRNLNGIYRSVEILDIAYNPIEDFSELRNLTNLTTLYVSSDMRIPPGLTNARIIIRDS
jgi:Leucine-rich repeat (LRR) protein